MVSAFSCALAEFDIDHLEAGGAAAAVEEPAAADADENDDPEAEPAPKRFRGRSTKFINAQARLDEKLPFNGITTTREAIARVMRIGAKHNATDILQADYMKEFRRYLPNLPLYPLARELAHANTSVTLSVLPVCPNTACKKRISSLVDFKKMTAAQKAQSKCDCGTQHVASKVST